MAILGSPDGGQIPEAPIIITAIDTRRQTLHLLFESTSLEGSTLICVGICSKYDFMAEFLLEVFQSS